MSRQAKIRSVIICDDIRKEVSGKDICIGVYSGVIVLKQLPSLLPKLAVRIDFEYAPSGNSAIEVAVVDPRKNKLFHSPGELIVGQSDEPGAMVFDFGPVPLVMPGRYEIHLGLAGPMRPITRFTVRIAPPAIG